MTFDHKFTVFANLVPQFNKSVITSKGPPRDENGNYQKSTPR